MGNIERLIMNVIVFLFSKHRHLIFTSFNLPEYFEAINKLKEHGLSYRSRITSLHTGVINSHRNDTATGQYDIYVKKDQQHLAEKALNISR